LLVLILLVPIWQAKYFLSNDGPCHLYNSKLILDFVLGNHTDFYSEYYKLNSHAEPNWFSHASLALLLFFLPAFLAEKILLTAYVLLFAFSFRFLIRQINPQSTFLIFPALLFVYHFVFQMGFWNFSFSIAFFFLVIAFWMKFENQWTTRRLLLLSVLLTTLYFMHPVGLMLTIFSIALITAIRFFSVLITPSTERNWKPWIKTFLYSVGAALPAIILSINYLSRSGTGTTPAAYSQKFLRHYFLELKSLVILNHTEDLIAMMVSVFIGIIFLIAFVNRIRAKKMFPADSFLLLFFISLYLYLHQPASLGGVGIVPERLLFIPFLLAIIWAANANFHTTIKKLVAIFSLVFLCIFMYLRLPVYQKNSDAVKEYLSVGDYIEDESTILPLSFAHAGFTPDGKPISDRIWVFIHATDYLGTMKPLIMFGNYEANTGWFPLIWKGSRNPFQHISKDAGIEGLPPSVDLLNYKANTGGSIDYVLLWCFDFADKTQLPVQDLISQLDQEYQLIFVSEHSRAKLYRHKIL